MGGARNSTTKGSKIKLSNENPPAKTVAEKVFKDRKKQTNGKKDKEEGRGLTFIYTTSTRKGVPNKTKTKGNQALTPPVRILKEEKLD